MKKTTKYVTTLIIAEITGCITQQEQEQLNELRQYSGNVRALSDFLYENPPAEDEEEQDPAINRQKAFAIISKAEWGAKQAKIRTRVKRVILAACLIAVLLLVIKTGYWQPPPQLAGNNATIDSTKVMFLKRSGNLLLTGSKLTIDPEKGLLINDSLPLAVLQKSDKKDSARLLVPGGKVYTMELSDGTEITANSATEISTPLLFNDQLREIRIKKGEVFLDVHASAERPFVVHLPNGYVKVLGTRLNVNTYENNSSTISLLAGKATITCGRYTEELQPGYAATVTATGITVAPFNPAKDTSWMTGIIHLKNVNEDEWGEITQRYFGENLIIESPLQTNLGSAVIDKTEPIDSFLIHLAEPEKIRREADGYHIK